MWPREVEAHPIFPPSSLLFCLIIHHQTSLIKWSINTYSLSLTLLITLIPQAQSQIGPFPKFNRPRLARLAGYNDPPVFLSSLNFEQLPPISTYQGRLVEHYGETYEFWSPNSRRLPYCPGLCVDSITIDVPADPSQRRTDGHVGRFDPCVSPQMSPSKPWLALVLSSLPPGKTTYNMPEMSIIYDVFVPATNIFEGTFQKSFLTALSARAKKLDAVMRGLQYVFGHDTKRWWADRPTAPADEDLAGLEGEIEFDIALDQYTYISRALKVKASWVEFMQRQAKESRWSISRELMKTIQPAEEWWMGTWANDLDEEMAIWFIRQRVPLFFAHQCTEIQISRCCQDEPRRSSFVDDTDFFMEDALDAEAFRTHKISAQGLKNSRILSKSLLPPPNRRTFSRYHACFPLGRLTDASSSMDSASLNTNSASSPPPSAQRKRNRPPGDHFVQQPPHLVPQVFTHISLRRTAESIEDNVDHERFVHLGQVVLDAAVTSTLFNQRPILTAQEMISEREAALCDDHLNKWVTLYNLRSKLRCHPNVFSTLKQETRSLFYSFIGGVYVEDGMETVQEWINYLLGGEVEDAVPVGSQVPDNESPQGPPFERPSKKVKSDFASQPPPSPPMNKQRRLSPHMHSASSMQRPGQHMQPLVHLPNPLSPAQPSLSFLPLFNQTAAQRRVVVEYLADFSGPLHAGTWSVRCIVNGIEKGVGTGPNKQTAKEEAARRAYYAMGWT
ncbi:hypothetical protein H0H93_013861 [Arthromyces matolae]|nr:hypothetical protein H0H93_013861 [Arthromyces matolae]